MPHSVGFRICQQSYIIVQVQRKKKPLDHPNNISPLFFSFSNSCLHSRRKMYVFRIPYFGTTVLVQVLFPSFLIGPCLYNFSPYSARSHYNCQLGVSTAEDIFRLLLLPSPIMPFRWFRWLQTISLIHLNACGLSVVPFCRWVVRQGGKCENDFVREFSRTRASSSYKLSIWISKCDHHCVR